MNQMNIYNLSDALCEIFRIEYKESLSFSLRGVRLWSRNATKTRNDFLYITEKWNNVLSARTEHDPAFVLVRIPDNDLPLYDPSWDNRMIFLHTQKTITEIQDHVQDILDDYHTWYNTCIDMILNGSDISTLLDFAAKMLKNPIALFDAGGILIHKAGVFSKNVEGTLWEEVLRSGFIPIEYVMPDELSQIMEGYSQGDRIVSGFFRKDPDHHFLAAPVFLDGKMVGAFGTIDINVPFTKGQESIIADICQIMEAAFRQAEYVDVLINEEHRCPKRLLYGFAANHSTISMYLQTRKWREDDQWRVYHFQLPSPDSTGAVVSAYINQIASVLSNASLFAFEDAIIGIARTIDFDPMNVETRVKLGNMLSRISVRCLISEPFSDFEHLEQYHGQCRLLATIEVSEKESVMLFSHYFLDILLGILKEKNSTKGFCHPVIYALWKSEKEQNRALVNNLKYYLLNGRNIAETTRFLRVHRNTLIYRLQKMESLLQLTLIDLDESMFSYLLISCLLCETL